MKRIFSRYTLVILLETPSNTRTVLLCTPRAPLEGVRAPLEGVRAPLEGGKKHSLFISAKQEIFQEIWGVYNVSSLGDIGKIPDVNGYFGLRLKSLMFDMVNVDANISPIKPISTEPSGPSVKKAYVIHYSKLTARKEILTKSFHDEMCEFDTEWLSGFDRENLTDEIIDEYTINSKCVNGTRTLLTSEISNGICHLYAIQEISKLAPDEIGMVIEDDITLRPGFTPYLRNVLQALQKLDFEICTIGGWFEHWIFGVNDPTDYNKEGPPEIIQPPLKAVPTGCYLLTGKAARKILGHHLVKPFGMPIDTVLSEIARRLDLNVFWVNPWIAVESSKTNGESSIGRSVVSENSS